MLYNLLLIFFLYLPVQIALSPTAGIDLATARVIVPLLALGWLFVGLKKKKIVFPFGLQTLFLLSFLFFCVFSIFFAQNTDWSLRKLLFILSLLPVYFILPAFFNNEKKIRQAVTWLIYGGVLLALIGIVQFFAQFVSGSATVSLFWSTHVAPLFLGNTFSQTVDQYQSWLVHIRSSDYMRAISVFPDPHMLAFYLGMLFPWALAFFAVDTKNNKKFLLFALILLLTDLLTFSRGGYLGLFCGLLFALFVFRRKIGYKLFLGAFIVLAVFFAYPANPITSRFVSSFDLQEGSNSARIALWTQAIGIIEKNPLGVGLGNYPLEVKPSADYREPIYAHCLYLDIAAEMGVAAVIFWILFITSAIVNFIKKSRHNNFYLAGAASLIIFSGHALVENPLFSVHVFTLLLIMTSFAALRNNKDVETITLPGII